MIPKGNVKRHAVLFGSLAATIAAAIAVGGERPEPSIIGPAVGNGRSLEIPEGRRTADVAKQVELQLLSLAPRGGDEDRTRLFRVPPPPPSPIQEKTVEEKPVAPPLPIRFLGRLEQEDGTVVLLSLNGQDHVTKVGDSLGGTYRLVEIAATALGFVYLPLNEKQMLNIGEGK